MGMMSAYTDETTLSDYTPEKLVNALKNILPRGLSAAEMFVSATHFSDPAGFEKEDLSDEAELTPETEPATLRFSRALIEAGLTESVNYGPVKRFNADNNLEFKQTTDQWVLYEAVNEDNPILLEYTHQEFGAASMIAIGSKIVGLVLKGKSIVDWKESLDEAISENINTVSLVAARKLPLDGIEDTAVKSSETRQCRNG